MIRTGTQFDFGCDVLKLGFIENLIDEISRQYETRDVFSIAEKAGVSIIHQNWHPATIGEFEKRTKTIRVNRTALEKAEDAKTLERKIVAHELGHFFALDLKMGKKEEEVFAQTFAENLLRYDE